MSDGLSLSEYMGEFPGVLDAASRDKGRPAMYMASNLIYENKDEFFSSENLSRLSVEGLAELETQMSALGEMLNGDIDFYEGAFLSSNNIDAGQDYAGMHTPRYIETMAMRVVADDFVVDGLSGEEVAEKVRDRIGELTSDYTNGLDRTAEVEALALELLDNALQERPDLLGGRAADIAGYSDKWLGVLNDKIDQFSEGLGVRPEGLEALKDAVSAAVRVEEAGLGAGVDASHGKIAESALVVSVPGGSV